MAHVRKQIRDAVATTVTGLATTGANVYKGRFYPINGGKLPALCVYTTSEQSVVNVFGSGRGTDRELQLVVEVYARSKTTVEDTLDQIAVEVEEAIAADTDIGGLAKDIVYSSMEVDADADPEQTVAVARLIYAVTYRVAETDVETAI
jgi:hypothetical protein